VLSLDLMERTLDKTPPRKTLSGLGLKNFIYYKLKSFTKVTLTSLCLTFV